MASLALAHARFLSWFSRRPHSSELHRIAEAARKRAPSTGDSPQGTDVALLTAMRDEPPVRLTLTAVLSTSLVLGDQPQQPAQRREPANGVAGAPARDEEAASLFRDDRPIEMKPKLES